MDWNYVWIGVIAFGLFGGITFSRKGDGIKAGAGFAVAIVAFLEVGLHAVMAAVQHAVR